MPSVQWPLRSIHRDKEVSCYLVQLTTAWGKQKRISAVTEGHYPWLFSDLRWTHFSKDKPHSDMLHLLAEPEVRVNCLTRLLGIKHVTDCDLGLGTDKLYEVFCDLL